jgi:hypothetical protein
MKQSWDKEIEKIKAIADEVKVWDDIWADFSEVVKNQWIDVFETNKCDQSWANLYSETNRSSREVGKLFPSLTAQLKSITTRVNSDITQLKKEEAKRLKEHKAKDKAEKAKADKERRAKERREKATADAACRSVAADDDNGDGDGDNDDKDDNDYNIDVPLAGIASGDDDGNEVGSDLEHNQPDASTSSNMDQDNSTTVTVETDQSIRTINNRKGRQQRRTSQNAAPTMQLSTAELESKKAHDTMYQSHIVTTRQVILICSTTIPMIMSGEDMMVGLIY